MQATDDLTPLGHQILEHWSKYRPKMVATLSARNQLPQAIFAAQELTGNLLYELAVVRKMDYQIAWELATREWAFLPDEEDQPQLSFDPATLDPSQPLPAISAQPTLTESVKAISEKKRKRISQQSGR